MRVTGKVVGSSYLLELHQFHQGQLYLFNKNVLLKCSVKLVNATQANKKLYIVHKNSPFFQNLANYQNSYKLLKISHQVSKNLMWVLNSCKQNGTIFHFYVIQSFEYAEIRQFLALVPSRQKNMKNFHIAKLDALSKERSMLKSTFGLMILHVFDK